MIICLPIASERQPDLDGRIGPPKVLVRAAPIESTLDAPWPSDNIHIGAKCIMTVIPKRLSVSLEPYQSVALEELAADLGISLAKAIGIAIDHYVLGVQWRSTIGAVVVDEIRAGHANREIVARLQERFPHAELTLPTVAWYRAEMRREDPTVPSDVEARHGAGRKKAAKRARGE